MVLSCRLPNGNLVQFPRHRMLSVSWVPGIDEFLGKLLYESGLPVELEICLELWISLRSRVHLFWIGPFSVLQSRITPLTSYHPRQLKSSPGMIL